MDSPNHILNRVGAGPDSTENYGPLEDQIIDFYNFAANTNKVVVLLHGGFWKPEYDRTHLRTLACALSKDGHRVALMEYRRNPGQPDVSTSDVKEALKHLHQMPGSANSQLILVGHSAGGHLALWAAVNSDYVSAVIALAPVCNFLGGINFPLLSAGVEMRRKWLKLDTYVSLFSTWATPTLLLFECLIPKSPVDSARLSPFSMVDDLIIL